MNPLVTYGVWIIASLLIGTSSAKIVRYHWTVSQQHRPDSQTKSNHVVVVARK